MEFSLPPLSFYKKSKAAQDVEYPAYGITGPNKEKLSPSSGDRRLAQNAQMYHYQHQKQQIIAMENKMNENRNGSLSDAANSEDEEGDYTVYECPGLGAHTGEMEVKNPLFFDDPTPATPAGNTQKAATAPEPPAGEGQGKKAASSTTAPAGHKKGQKK